jgi:hypothetical protein
VRRVFLERDEARLGCGDSGNAHGAILLSRAARGREKRVARAIPVPAQPDALASTMETRVPASTVLVACPVGEQVRLICKTVETQVELVPASDPCPCGGCEHDRELMDPVYVNPPPLLAERLSVSPMPSLMAPHATVPLDSQRLMEPVVASLGLIIWFRIDVPSTIPLQT